MLKLVLVAVLLAGICNGKHIDVETIEKDLHAVRDVLDELKSSKDNEHQALEHAKDALDELKSFKELQAFEEEEDAPPPPPPKPDTNGPPPPPKHSPMVVLGDASSAEQLSAAEDAPPPPPPKPDTNGPPPPPKHSPMGVWGDAPSAEQLSAAEEPRDVDDKEEENTIDATNNKVPGHEKTFFEGDILMTDKDKADLKRKLSGKNVGSDAIRNTRMKWTNNVVPYRIQSLSSRGRQALQQASAEYAAKTCIKLKPRTNERNYVNIVGSGGCSSYIGMIGGQQTITLGNGCGYKATVTHEFMHALGFWHEQSRLDRDQYIKVGWNNIQRGMASQFKKYTSSQAQTFGYPYDLKSVMQYGNTAFGAGRITMSSIKYPSMKLGQPTNGGLSDIDAKTLNALYCGGKDYGGNGGTGGGNSGTDKAGEICGFFKKNQKFCSQTIVQRNCAGSCPPPPTAKPTARPTAKPCRDKSTNCATWSKTGYCRFRTYYTWMTANCPKSCGKC